MITPSLPPPSTEQRRLLFEPEPSSASRPSAPASWEQHLISWLASFHQWRQQENDEEGVDERYHPRRRSSSTASWLLRQLRSLVPSSQKGFVTACALTVLVLVGNKRRRRIQQHDNNININNYRSATEAPLSLLYKAAREGQIERALLGSSGIFYLLTSTTGENNTTASSSWKRSTLPPHLSSKDLLDTLSTTCNHVAALPESLASRLATPALAALPFCYLYFMYRMLQNTMGGGDISQVLSSKSTTTFDDVAGLDNVLADVGEVVQYLQHPKRYEAVGARPPRAVLLYGPPGSGKTLLAQAVAGQANVDCFLACSASDFVEVYVGRGAARVRSLFAQARQSARRSALWRNKVSSFWPSRTSRRDDYKPSAILFIDELDALGKTRGMSGFSSNDEREQTLNALLTAMDGFDNNSKGDKKNGDTHDDDDDGDSDDNNDVTLIVMAASNRADVLDPALLRRFDRQHFVGYPDANGRREILKIHARHVVHDPNVDWHRLASDARTGGCSGADLRNLVNDAALLAVRDASKVVRQEHLEHAARRVQQTKVWNGGDDELDRNTANSSNSSSRNGRRRRGIH